MRRRHLVLGLLGLVSAITFIDRLAIAVCGPAIQKDLALTPSQWGWALSAYVIANGIFEIPSGATGDRRGHRWEFFRIAAWWSTFTGLTALARGFWSLVGARFLFGLGTAGAYPNAAGVLGRWFPASERARGQGVIWAASRLGGALAPLLLVPLERAFGWRAVFWTLAAVGLAWAIAWAVWFRDDPHRHPGVSARELEEIGPAADRAAHGRAPWGRLARNRQLLLIVLAYGCYAWASWFYFSWFPTWLVHAGGFSAAQMGVFASLPFLLGIVANLVGGVVCDALGRKIGRPLAYRWITGVCLAVTATLLLAMSLARGHVAIVALSTVSFGAMDLMLPAAWAMCTAVGGSWSGAATGMMNTAGQAGGLLCTVFFGYAVSATGDYQLPVRMVALMVLIAAVLFALVDARRGIEAQPA